MHARRGAARGGSHTGKLTPHYYHIAQQHPARRRSETNVVISWPVALRHGAIAPQTLPREGEGSLPRRLVSVKMSWAGAASEGEAVKLSVLWHCPTALQEFLGLGGGCLGAVGPVASLRYTLAALIRWKAH